VSVSSDPERTSEQVHENRKKEQFVSAHPNAILLCTLTPDGLARKTFRAIMAEPGADVDVEDIKIGDASYSVLIMESDYDTGYEISANEGDIIVFNFATYGYGEQIAWDELSKRKDALEAWARGISERHNCTFKISVTANYW